MCESCLHAIPRSTFLFGITKRFFARCYSGACRCFLSWHCKPRRWGLDSVCNFFDLVRKAIVLDQGHNVTKERVRKMRKITVYKGWTGKQPSVKSILSQIVQKHMKWQRCVCARGLDICYVSISYLIFFFCLFCLSLISLTPFPKIEHSFAYLQCDNSAVRNNTLSCVYSLAHMLLWRSKICQPLETKEEINSYCQY